VHICNVVKQKVIEPMNVVLRHTTDMTQLIKEEKDGNKN